jgi:predicted aspartyl protease
MRARKNEYGLFEFDVKIIGPKSERVIKGIVDTGSTLCACTYKLVTTLKIKPIDHRKVTAVEGKPERRLVYFTRLEFDKHEKRVAVVRLTTLPPGFDFILGMSVLDFCDIEKSDNHMIITWKK